MLIAAMAFLIIADPAAEAARYTYADKTNTKEWVFRYSGVRPKIAGGYANAHWGVEGLIMQVRVETYYPAPGYTTVALATGGGTASMTHATQSNASQKCAWDWGWHGGTVDGSVPLTC